MADREEYFRKRSLKDAARKINLTENFINGKLKKYYEIATKEIQLEIEDLYEKFADEEDITLAQAKKYISAAEFNKIDFKTSVKEALKIKDVEMLKYLNTLSKKSQITRLELLNLEVQKSISKLYNSQQTNIYEYLSNTYKDSYFRGVFNTQTYFQIGYDFVSPNENVIKQAVTRDWSKANYSKRLWNHKKELSETLREDITTGLIQGKSVNEMAKKIAKDMQVSLNNAKRLVRTETNYIHNQATLDEYTNYANIEQYRYLATLDFKTSPICQELDGKTFNTEDAKVGRNYPPMHPNCRGTTTAHFEDEPEFIRIARDANGQTYYVPENITYKEWFDSLSEDEKGKMRLNLKQHQNHKDDVEQLKRYKKVLGKESPNNIEQFQYIKYNDKEKWKELKSKYTSTVRGLSSNNDTLNHIPKHDPPKLLEKLINTSDDIVLSKLKEYEKIIVKDGKKENAIVITKDGEVWHCFGVSDRVFPDADLGKKLYGASVTHNHPIDETIFTFSNDDIDLFRDYKLKVLRGIDEKYSYQIDENTLNIDKPKNDSLFDMTVEDYWHNVNINYCKENGYGYRREKH